MQIQGPGPVYGPQGANGPNLTSSKKQAIDDYDAMKQAAYAVHYHPSPQADQNFSSACSKLMGDLNDPQHFGSSLPQTAMNSIINITKINANPPATPTAYDKQMDLASDPLCSAILNS